MPAPGVEQHRPLRPGQIAIVGEAFGEHEERVGKPFVGPSGAELTRMLREAGISRAGCLLTNVINRRPPSNKIEAYCGGRVDSLGGYPPLVKSKYLRAEFAPELERLAVELINADPNIVVCLGNTALWALTGLTAITKHRGTTLLSTHTVTGFKILPTYHPAAILRQWELRPTLVADLIKARRESAFPEIRRPERTIFIPETIEELEALYEEHLARSTRCTVDIETAGRQITCIGFAPERGCAIVVPFTDRRSTNRSYWRNQEDELSALRIIARILNRKGIKKTFQNGLYDIAFIFRAWGMKVVAAQDDTMLLHHALQPESLKGLGYLGSIYTDEGSWKQMREKRETIKRDD